MIAGYHCSIAGITFLKKINKQIPRFENKILIRYYCLCFFSPVYNFSPANIKIAKSFSSGGTGQW